MIDIKKRNKEVKNILNAYWGKGNVSVTNGRGTAYGWCNISICAGNRLSQDEYYTQSERSMMHDIRILSEKLLKNVDFYKHSDDMNDIITQVYFSK